MLKASNQAAPSEARKSSTQEDGFKEVRRRKRHSTNEDAPTSKKTVSVAEVTTPKEVATRNFFAFMKTSMETENTGAEAASPEDTVSGKAGRPPPIIFTSTVNLIQLQKQLKNEVKGDFEFHSTRNGTRVVTKGLADFEAAKTHFNNNSQS
jgi:hypothetical protein